MRAEAIERELDDKEYEEVLNKLYGTVEICGMTFDSGYALRELDPTAFRCEKVDYEDGLETEEWKCGVCGNVFDNEDEAEECCTPEEEEEEIEE